MNYLRWEQAWLPRQCAEDEIKVFHSPIHYGLPIMTRAKCVLTLHDAIDEVYYAPKLREKSWNQIRSGMMCAASRRRADHIITVSHYSKRELVRHFKFQPDSVTAIYEAADSRFRKNPPPEERVRVRAKYGLPRRFVFYVGSLEPRKNLVFLLNGLAASESPSLSVVIGGRGNKAEIDALRAAARDLKIQDQVFLIGRVDDDDLPAIYSEAEAFTYPSEYEGFGLQMCEAMSAGCPVFASNASCLPEILADGGETFPLSHVEPLAALLRRNHMETDYRESMKIKAEKRSRFFSWEKAALETCSLYEQLCGDAHTAKV